MKPANVRILISFTALLCCGPLVAQTPAPAPAQSPSPAQTPGQMIRAQQAAIGKLAMLDGVWRGTGWIMERPGDAARQLTQTLRAGAILDGTVRLIEIRGFQTDGSVGFHAFNTISFDAQTSSYVMTARAGGRAGNFSFQATAQGYTWNIGDDTHGLKYTATIRNGVWTEIGESLSPGQPPIKVSEWTLRRVESTDWPEGGAPAAK